MKTINIKGKDYVMVHERIKSIAKKDPFQNEYSIETDYQFYPEFKMWVVKARLELKGNIYTGLAQEIIDDGYINATSALENCETSAVGRAFGMAGIGIDTGFASADEMQKATTWMSEQEKNECKRLIAEGETEQARKIMKERKMKRVWREELEKDLSVSKSKKPDDFVFDK